MTQIKERRISPEWIAAGLMLWLAFTLGMFILAPGRDEQSAMRGRDLSTQAQLAAEQGDTARSLALLEQAVQDPRVDPAVTGRLLAAYQKMGRSAEHAAIVTGPLGTSLGVAQLRNAAGYYGQLKLAQPRLVALERLVLVKGADATDVAHLAEARFLAGNKAGATEAVKIAMQGVKAGENPAAVGSIVRTLNGVDKRSTVAKFARDWLVARPPLAKILEVAPSFTENGGAFAVENALRERRAESKEALEAYDYALATSAKDSPAARALATRQLLADVSAEKDAQRKKHLLDTLFSVGDMKMIADDFAQSGAWRSEPMRSRFVFNMKRAGLQPQLRSMLAADLKAGRSSGLPGREAARELAALGAVGDAIPLLKSAAAKAGPNSSEFKDLAYLWKSKKITPDLAWMRSQALAAKGTARIDWIVAIERAASPAEAVTSIEQILPNVASADRPTLLVAKARYLGWKGDSVRLRDALGDVAEQTLAYPDQLEMAKLSCAVGDTASTRKLLSAKVLTEGGPSIRACYTRGRLQEARAALKRGDKKTATAIYAAIVAGPNGMSAQDYFDYAIATDSLGRKAEAQDLFEAALNGMGRSASKGSSDASELLMRATILSKLNRLDEAQRELQQVVMRYPDNSRAQLMLAELQLQRGDYRGALAMTDGQSQNP